MLGGSGRRRDVPSCTFATSDEPHRNVLDRLTDTEGDAEAIGLREFALATLLVADFRGSGQHQS